MTLGSKYDRSFYLDQRDDSRQAAFEIVPMILSTLRITSVIDVGCGLGTWLSVFQQNGIEDFVGVDGHHVERHLLQIPEAHFRAADLDGGLEGFGRRFDCAVSLEVAEHLQPKSSKRFVQALTALSDVVLFSAAIPKQGGTGHINEQWPEYWALLFREAGYVAVDWLRPKIWDNDRIVWWYRQNMITFVAQERLSSLFPEWDSADPASLLTRIHPELLLWVEARQKWFGTTYNGDVEQYRRTVQAYREAAKQ